MCFVSLLLQQVLHWYDEYPIDYMTEEELGNLAFLESPPRLLLAKAIVNLFKSPNPIRILKVNYLSPFRVFI